MIEKELALLQANRAKLEQQMKDAGARAEKLEEELETNRILMDAHERDYKKIAGDPDRLHKQADKFASAVSSLEQQCKQVR